MNVGNPLAKATVSLDIGEFTQKKGPMSAGNVGNPLAKAVLSVTIREFTLEKGLMSAVSVGSFLPTTPVS